MATSRVYTYTPLNQANRWIRLVELQPATTSDVFELEVRTVSLAECPSYTAVSYEWGSDQTFRTVLLDGKEFNVRENLWNFLHTMRLDGRWRLFWIDAICIDQSNTLERSHQVNQMGQIYTQADLVVIWLGNSDTSSDTAIEYITDEAFLHSQSEPEPTIIYLRLIHALRDFFDRPYWSRVWIIQELMLARDIVFFSGQKNFTWHQISSTRKRSKDFNHPERNHLWDAYTYTVGSPAWLMIGQKTLWEALPEGEKDFPLLELFETYKYHKCSDPRDHVYGLLGLAGDNIVQPDYTISAEDLYFVVLQTIEKAPQSRKSPNFQSAISALRDLLLPNHGMSLLPKNSRDETSQRLRQRIFTDRH